MSKKIETVLMIIKYDLKIYQSYTLYTLILIIYMASVSFYIPVIADGIREDFIAKIFKHKNIGIVERVDFVLNKQKVRREAFVHFKEYFDNGDANTIKESISDGSAVPYKFYYKEDRYWALLLNKNPATSQATRKSTNVYDLEEQILSIKKEMEKLSFMAKIHDANIRYMMRKPVVSAGTQVDDHTQKRAKTDNSIACDMV